MDVEDTFDESAVYKGKVKNFRNSVSVLVTPDADLTALGVKEGGAIKVAASDIVSTESPAVLVKEQEVEFKLRKDEWGVYGYTLTGPGGSPIGPAIGAPERKPQPARTPVNGGQVYTGKVKNFLWAQGFGYITINNPETFVVPEIANDKEKKKFEKNKDLWFCRDDIVSMDSAVGVDKEAEVRFTVYTDEKGIGAQNIMKADGSAFSGVKWALKRGPKPQKTKKKKKGQKRNASQVNFGNAAQMMGGMQGVQMVMMNGIPFMMVPVQNKKRKKNKKKKSKWTKEEREAWNAQKKAEKEAKAAAGGADATAL